MTDAPTLDTRNCPNCGADCRGAPIPEDSRELYGGRTHFSRWRWVNHLWRNQPDGHSIECPDCLKRWKVK